MNDTLLDDFERPLGDLCTTMRLRAIEAGGSADTLWQDIDALGFTDALVSEKHGGAGLGLVDFFPLVFAAGKAGLGLPFGETAVARALITAAGHGALMGTGPIAIATCADGAGDTVLCRNVPGGALARQLLVLRHGEWLLLPRESAQSTPGSWRPQVSATLQWHTQDMAATRFDGKDGDAISVCSALHAAGMAGAMARVLELVTDYARDRQQFGRPIGQFQAIQQDLSVLAEQAHSATLAARLGCSVGRVHPDPLHAATAKLWACQAASRVAAIAHAIFGAIGITEEHVLGLYTTRLHEWRAAPGTEAQCAQLLGDAMLSQPDGLLDFVRLRLSAPANF